MKTVLLESARETLRPKLLRALEDTSVFTAASDEEALRTLRLTEMELIIKEATPPLKNLAPFIARARHLAPTGVIVCVLTPGAATSEDESAAEAADFVLLQPFTTRHLQALLKQAEDKLRLLQEVAALRSARRPADDGAHESPVSGPPASSHASTQMAKEFAKTLAAGFDLPRVLDQFLDGVAELARPSRCAILLADPVTRHYRVAAYRALAPHVVESLTLSADGGLPLWLATEGRLIQLDEAQSRITDAASREVARELAVLQSVVAIPLSSHGELVGILTLGQRITGGGYRRDETETLFNLGTHLATAIRDIRMHHLLHYEKEFNERILARVNAGGEIMDHVLSRLNIGARIPLCGMISQYTSYGDSDGPAGQRQIAQLIMRRATMSGFLVLDHVDRFPEAIEYLAGLLAEGKLKYDETIVDGLENARDTLNDMFSGSNVGKLLIKVS